MPARDACRAGDKHGLEPAKPAAVQPRRADRRRPVSRGIQDMAQINPAVRRKVRVEGDIHQPALAVGLDARQPPKRVRRLPARLQDAEIAFQLRHQHPPVRQEGHAPRLVERAADRDEAEGVLLRAVFARPGGVGGAARNSAQAEQGGERGRPDTVAGPAMPTVIDRNPCRRLRSSPLPACGERPGEGPGRRPAGEAPQVPVTLSNRIDG